MACSAIGLHMLLRWKRWLQHRFALVYLASALHAHERPDVDPSLSPPGYHAPRSILRGNCPEPSVGGHCTALANDQLALQSKVVRLLTRVLFFPAIPHSRIVR